LDAQHDEPAHDGGEKLTLVAILVRAIELVVIVLMGTITALVIAEVALRGLAGTSLIVTDELSRYLMVWTAMLAATVLVYEDGHLRSTILPDALPPRAARFVYVVSDLIVLCFLGAVAGSSIALLVSVKEQSTVTLGISMLWFYAALPVCAALMFALVLRALVLRFTRDWHMFR
jgi:TRAP-type C4-dicarboxylate transport system permease small subunit